MPKTQKEVKLVGIKGVPLPTTTGKLVSETADSLVIESTESVGRGRGAKIVTRQYVVPRCSLAYYYSEVLVDGDSSDVPAVEAKRARLKKVVEEGEAAEPKKRGRPKKVVEEGEAAEPKKRGDRKSVV